MSSIRVRLVVMGLVVGLVMALPAAATARPSSPSGQMFVERGLTFSTGEEWDFPGVSGDQVVYSARSVDTGNRWVLRLRNLVTGSEVTTFFAEPGFDIWAPRISGDWVTWFRNNQVMAKNTKTGQLVSTPAIPGVEDTWPTVSGDYLAWQSHELGIDWDVKGWNLKTGTPVTIAASPDINEYAATVYGKRVSYLDDEHGYSNVRVATIGSSADPTLLSTAGAQPTLGDHIVAWTEHNLAGMDAMHYYDYETGETYAGPSNDSYNVVDLSVSGDRIAYRMLNSNGDTDVWLFDTRAARSGPFANGLISIAMTEANEYLPKMSGNDIVYLNNGLPIWGTLTVPTISLNAVPTRIARRGHIHLAGSISDLGHRVGLAPLKVQKYTGGHWVTVKTLTTSASGTFSYQTPATTAKTLYRVVYDGDLWPGTIPFRRHLSAVSSVKTAWPR